MINKFPTNLKYLRCRENMTQEELARKMDKDYSTIGKWELGQRNPIMADLIKLSNIFNVDVQDFVEKDLRIKNNSLDKLDILFNKSKDILSDDDKQTIEFIMKKTIDNYEKNKNNN